MSTVRQWSLVTALVVVAVLAAGWFLLVSPKRGEASDLRSEGEQQRTTNAQLRTQLATLRAQAARLPEQRARLSQIREKLPDDSSLPSLIRGLTNAASDAGVEIGTLSPGQPVAASQGSTGAAGAASAPGLMAVPVTLQVDGGFFQVEQFLNNLERLPRAYLVTGVTLTPGEKPQPSGGPAAAGGASPGGSTTGSTSGGAMYTGNLKATVTGKVFLARRAATSPSAPAPAPAPATAPGGGASETN